jgi:hypothetical protein
VIAGRMAGTVAPRPAVTAILVGRLRDESAPLRGLGTADMTGAKLAVAEASTSMPRPLRPLTIEGRGPILLLVRVTVDPGMTLTITSAPTPRIPPDGLPDGRAVGTPLALLRVKVTVEPAMTLTITSAPTLSIPPDGLPEERPVGLALTWLLVRVTVDPAMTLTITSALRPRTPPDGLTDDRPVGMVLALVLVTVTVDPPMTVTRTSAPSPRTPPDGLLDERPVVGVAALLIGGVGEMPLAVAPGALFVAMPANTTIPGVKPGTTPGMNDARSGAPEFGDSPSLPPGAATVSLDAPAPDNTGAPG